MRKTREWLDRTNNRELFQVLLPTGFIVVPNGAH